MPVNNTERGGIATFTLVIAQNERRPIGVRGVFLRIKEAGVPLTITTRSTKIGSGDGRAFTNTMKKFEKIFTDTEFDEVVVSHDSDSTQSIELQIGYGDYEAEIISRTLAAQTFRNRTFRYDDDGGPIEIDANGFYEAQVAPENLQRKRIAWSANWENASTGGGTLEVMWGPSNLATFADIREQCCGLDAFSGDIPVNLYPSGNLSDSQETTAAISVYFLEVSGSDSVGVNNRFATYEEVYSAA